MCTKFSANCSHRFYFSLLLLILRWELYEKKLGEFHLFFFSEHQVQEPLALEWKSKGSQPHKCQPNFYKSSNIHGAAF